MTFDLRAILILILAALVYAGLLRARWRAWALLVGSLVAMYWLQPALPIQYGAYVLPTAAIVATVVMWWITREADSPARSATLAQDLVTLGVIAVVVVGMSFMRFVDAEFRLVASRPPDPLAVVLTLAAVGVLMVGAARLLRRCDPRWALTGGLMLVVVAFVLLKTEPLAVELSRWWRGQTGQDTALASAADLNWLGFSYVAFRLIHTLRDRQTGLLPALSLREYVTYVIFFPSLTAGPIDRAERFVGDLRALPDGAAVDASRWTAGLTRIVWGLFQKLVIADSLAQGAALNTVNVAQVQSPAWLWVLLYGYALRLFFDFSGYSDIAIGLGMLFRVKLPENFDRPYLKTSITAFWQSWHMTLSSWARFYVFSPLSRWLLMREHGPSPTLIVLSAQIATMVVIGLWHGVTANFVAWGLWHGAGLFIHKQWSDRTRKWYRSLGAKPWRKRAWTLFAWFLTFQYVVVGWVWFALPDVGQGARTVARLFGMGW